MFQDPLRSLDPDLTVAELVGEPLAVAGVEKRERRAAPPPSLHRSVWTPTRWPTGSRPGCPAASASASRGRAIVTRPALLPRTSR